MAQSSRKTTSKRGPARGRAGRPAAKRNGGGDAITLLKSDHREVEGLFTQFEKARSESKKKGLADKICNALRAHATIEEEIFYPAFLEATGDKGTHHEAEVEHAGAKNLIAEIETSDPSDDYYDAKLKVLSEMIKHHVNEEEQRGGMFAEAKQSKMDLAELGAQLEQRKQELMLELHGDKPAKRGVMAALRDRNGLAPADAPRD
jgi:hypothetical protein